jgi:hypothetical protein
MRPPRTTTPLDGTREGSKSRPTETQPMVYCFVPPELSELVEPLVRHFWDDPVEVVPERRRTERRSGRDRRKAGARPPGGLERRLAPDLEGRRFGERRATLLPVEEQPALPPDLYCYADQLRFMRRFEGSRLYWQLARLRALAAEWRDRCRDAEREAAGLLRTLVGVADDLERVRPWSPRRFMAVRRAQRGIEHYRQSHSR